MTEKGERFWEFVEKNGPIPQNHPELGPCWMWTGTMQGRYGQHNANGTQYLAHRYIYEQTYGPLPKGHVAHHKCENRPCVRPTHLEPKTHLEHAHLHHPREIKEFCDHGHEMTPENTAIRFAKRGKEQRRCRICERESGRRYRERKGA